MCPPIRLRSAYKRNFAAGETMKTEVCTAVHFVTGLIRMSGLLTEDHLRHFSFFLQEALLEHYQNHWFPQAPCRGSGYRCLRINHKMDPVIGKAGRAIGITQEKLLSLLPSELTVWVDPNEVSYRIGENGSTCVLYKSSTTCPSTSITVRQSSSKRKLRFND